MSSKELLLAWHRCMYLTLHNTTITAKVENRGLFCELHRLKPISTSHLRLKRNCMFRSLKKFPLTEEITSELDPKTSSARFKSCSCEDLRYFSSSHTHRLSVFSNPVFMRFPFKCHGRKDSQPCVKKTTTSDRCCRTKSRFTAIIQPHQPASRVGG